MPVVSRFNLRGGIHTGPGDAGPEHCSDALNCYHTQGELRARSGQKAKFIAPPAGLAGAIPYGQCAFSGAGEPGVVTDTDPAAAMLPLVAGAGSISFYYGAQVPFELLKIVGLSKNSSTVWLGDEEFGSPLKMEYWNGTAWTELTAGKIIFGSKYDPTWDEYTSGPWWNVGANTPAATTQLLVTLKRPDDWSPKVIGGFGYYWLRFTPFLDISGATVNSAHYLAQHTNAICGMLPFISRSGGKHLFAVTNGVAGPQFCTGNVPPYRADSEMTQLSQAADLSESIVTYAGDTLDTWLGYAAESDRVVGHVTGHNWFYWIPGDTTVNLLDADPTGADTPYASVPQGLRAAIPGGEHRVLHDGRLFIASGQTIYWSSPGTYLDIWPKRNELALSDQHGNITGLATMNGVLVAFKRNIIYTLTPNGSEDGYDAQPMPSGIGCVGGLTLCGSFCLFISTDGLFQFDGTSLTKVSSNLDAAFFQGKVGANLDRARGVYFGPLNQWRLFFPKQEAFVMDAAWYVDLTGYTDDSRGEERREVAVWPQGRLSVAEYGFDATCLAVDNTETNAVMLIGSSRGIIWEADAHGRDPNAAVRWFAQQATQNLGRVGGAVIRRLNVTMATDEFHAPYFYVYPHGAPTVPDTLGQTYMDTWREVPLAAMANATAAANLNAAVGVRPYVTREASFGLRCRDYAIRVSEDPTSRSDGVRILGFEVEANRGGRREER